MTTDRSAPPPRRLGDLIERIGDLEALDPLVRGLRAAAASILRSARATDVLHGTPLGHPLHPVLVQTPVGAWLGAAVLDPLPGSETAADVLVGVGLAAAPTAALAGWADWTNLNPRQSRVGLVHAAGNLAAVGLYSASLWFRRRGRRGTGLALSYAGLGAVSIGGLLGGHLAYHQGAGVNHAALGAPAEPGWQPVAALDEIPVDAPICRDANGVAVLLYREDGGVRAYGGTCTHLGGPLGEGEVAGPTVRCPLHGSVFDLVDGAPRHGPATSALPRYETRVVDGQVQVRPAES